MSQFRTAIHVDVLGAAKLLPEGAFIERLDWDPENNAVILVWCHDQAKSLYNSSEWPLHMLRRQKLPEHVTLTNKAFDKPLVKKEKRIGSNATVDS